MGEMVAREEIVAAVVAIGLGLVTVLLLSVVSRLIDARRVLKDQRRLLAELTELAFETTIRPDPALSGLESSWASIEALQSTSATLRTVEDVPEGFVDAGIDVVDEEGRVVGTLAIPVRAN
jgi:hypothetical protein